MQAVISVGMRLIFSLTALSLIVYGYFWTQDNTLDLKTKAQELLDLGRFPTLEIRYQASQIMEANRRELLKSNRHRFLEPVLKFYPYLLMDVKYTASDTKTNEGVILWDLVDGEMVIDTRDWEKTHGFGDCISADTQRHEFKILNILFRKGGTSDRQQLSQTLHVDNEILDSWIDSCRRKKLIIQSGNNYRLHLQNPKFKIFPETKLDERLVTKPHKNALRQSRNFSHGQIQKLAKAAFGDDFAVRRATDIYLPVHSIVVQNPDGSIHTSHWNALNGKRLFSSQFIE